MYDPASWVLFCSQTIGSLSLTKQLVNKSTMLEPAKDGEYIPIKTLNSIRGHRVKNKRVRTNHMFLIG